MQQTHLRSRLRCRCPAPGRESYIAPSRWKLPFQPADLKSWWQPRSRWESRLRWRRLPAHGYWLSKQMRYSAPSPGRRSPSRSKRVAPSKREHPKSGAYTRACTKMGTRVSHFLPKNRFFLQCGSVFSKPLDGPVAHGSSLSNHRSFLLTVYRRYLLFPERFHSSNRLACLAKRSHAYW